MGKRYKTLIEAFFNQERECNKVIIVNRENEIVEIKYKDMISAAKKIARYFADHDVKKGDRIVLILSDINMFLSAFWGAIYIGASVVPVIPSQEGRYLKERQETVRLAKILEVTSPKYIVAGVNEIENLAHVLDTRINTLEVSKDILDKGIEMEECVEVSENDMAIILFTSGSTGVPKGVEISHKKILEGCYQNIDFFIFTQESRFLNWLPLEHIASLTLFHLLPSVLKATQVHVSTNVVLRDATNWLYYLDKYRIHATFGPNFIYKMLLNMKNKIEKMNLSLTDLTYMINGGEAIHYQTTEECLRILVQKGMSEHAMIPGWGMTEIGNGAIYSKSFGKILYKNCVAIGKPVSGLDIRIVKDGKLVLDDEVEGSLEIKADFILDAYLNETDEEHQENFKQGGWFKTGDFVVQKDGELIITGRESQIFIINGLNISINEIESHMEKALRDASMNMMLKVINIKDQESNSDELYVFMERNQKIEKEMVTSVVKACIVERYGFPIKHIIWVPENDFPRTAIGKIDTKMLLENYANDCYEVEVDTVNRISSSRLMDDSLSDEENLLLFIWSEALDIKKEQISLDDDFFNLGGNSAKIPSVLEKINIALNMNLDVAEFVRYSTINKLLSYIYEDAMENDTEEMIIL